MCNENVGICRDIGIVTTLTVGNATHKHWHAVEFNTVNLNSGVAEIMNIVVKTVDFCSIKTIVVVTADEYFVAIRNVAEPVHKVDCLGFASVQGKVTGMYQNISIGQII